MGSNYTRALARITGMFFMGSARTATVNIDNDDENDALLGRHTGNCCSQTELNRGANHWCRLCATAAAVFVGMRVQTTRCALYV